MTEEEHTPEHTADVPEESLVADAGPFVIRGGWLYTPKARE